MMKRKYKVGIKEPGVIGEVAQAGATRVILDIASESTYIKNPLLPYTRSEVAIPSRVPIESLVFWISKVTRLTPLSTTVFPSCKL